MADMVKGGKGINVRPASLRLLRAFCTTRRVSKVAVVELALVLALASPGFDTWVTLYKKARAEKARQARIRAQRLWRHKQIL